MKRVAILANDTTYTYNLRGAVIKELIENNYKVFIVAQVLKFERELCDIGCNVINMPLGRHSKNPLSDLKIIRNYYKILKKIKPDLVLSYNIKPNVYGGMICKKLKIRFMPNITGLGTALEYPGLMQKITTILYKYGLKKADTVFFQNSENQEFFLKNRILSKNTKTVLLPGSGVDLYRHKLLKYPNNKTIKFLYIARIMKDKGIDIFLDTAKFIKNKYPNTEFHICGYCDDEKYKEILTQYEEENIIIYHGEQKDMIPFFEKANCIVHPSYYPEGMSNVLLEAAAHGRPIICTDRNGCRETVEDSLTGYITRIKNTDDVIEAVEKIINMSNKNREQMGLNGRRKIEKEFDRKIVVDKYIEAISAKENKNRGVNEGPIRVLHVMGKLQIGGAETLVMNIFRKIDKNKIQFDFIVHGTEVGAYESEIEKMGGKIYRVPKYKGFNHFSYIKAWNKIFKEHPEYKIIHSHVRSTASIILKIAKRYNLTTISHSHSTSNGKGIKCLVKKILQKNIPKYSDYLFACSKESAVWLYGEKNAKSDRCIIINNAIDSSKYVYDEKIRAKKRKELGLDNKIVIGQVGRLEPVKNYSFTLKILKRCLEINSNYFLLIVGDGSLKNKIIEEIDKMSLTNNVIMLSNRNDVNELLQAIDVFIMPSIYEGLPLTLVEAQASDLPCIISSTISAGILDSNLVKKINLNDNIVEWCKAINSFSQYRRKDNSKLIISNQFDIKENVEWLEKIYAEMENK